MLGQDPVKLRGALWTGALEGRVTRAGGGVLVLGHHLQDWLDRGAPRGENDQSPLEIVGFSVGSPEPNRLAFTLSEAARLVSLSTTYLTDEINLRYLVAKRVGSRYVIPATSLESWLDRLESASTYIPPSQRYYHNFARWEPPLRRRQHWSW